jgi:hypothetical protein
MADDPREAQEDSQDSPTRGVKFTEIQNQQVVIMRIMTILIMLSVGYSLSGPNPDPKYPFAQSIFYICTAFIFFGLCFLSWKNIISQAAMPQKIPK